MGGSYYESEFNPTEKATAVLREGRILAPGETPSGMVERVVDTLAAEERSFTDSRGAEDFGQALGKALDRGDIVMSTPIMTNAGRYADRPLTACAVPSTALRDFPPAELRREIMALHEQGMGTGFNLDDVPHPAQTLRLLNQIAIDSASSGREDRPVGNMAVLSVYHPEISKFIDIKTDAPKTGEEWKFNISVDVDGPFMDAVEQGGVIELRDGRQENARRLFDRICTAAAATYVFQGSFGSS